MTHIDVFDPPMCCSTGVCGPSVDPLLATFAADVEWLRTVTVQQFMRWGEPWNPSRRGPSTSVSDDDGLLVSVIGAPGTGDDGFSIAAIVHRAVCASPHVQREGWDDNESGSSHQGSRRASDRVPAALYRRPGRARLTRAVPPLPRQSPSALRMPTGGIPSAKRADGERRIMMRGRSRQGPSRDVLADKAVFTSSALGGFSPRLRRHSLQRRIARAGIRRFWPRTFSPGSFPWGDACSISAFISAPTSRTSPEM